MLFYFLRFLCCFVIIVTAAYPEGGLNSQNDTVSHGHGVRIAGGEDPDEGVLAAPYQVQISIEGESFCSGAIINERYILTAAHCVEDVKPKEVTVRAGSNVRGEGVMLPIEEIVLHPYYDYPQNNLDIAYMRTVAPIPIGYAIRPAFIAKLAAPLPNKIHVTGWGYQGDGKNKLADKLMAIELPILSYPECQLFYPEKIIITKNMICGYSLRDMDRGACVGDGGGPATEINSRRLIGLSSFTRGCGPSMGPSVFTYVESEGIREFIRNGTSSVPKPKPSAEQPEDI